MSTKIQAAQAFATSVHGEQKYGNLPYNKHLEYVFEVLVRFGIQDEDILAAAWLHDSVEDTDATVDQINLVFGERVGDLVYRVTNELGRNRKERHEKTYPKIQACDDAITLKLADRIANVEHSLEQNNEIINMYLKEYEGFRMKLYKPGKHEAMWRHLDFLLNNAPPRSGAW